MHQRVIRACVTSAAVGVAVGLALHPGVGAASATPMVVCAGAVCTNHGDTVGIGYGNYRCPNGFAYPSIAIVPPHSTMPVIPANCGPGPLLYSSDQGETL